MTLRLAHNPRGHAVIRVQGLNANRPCQIEILNRSPRAKLPNKEIATQTQCFVAQHEIVEAVPLELICAPPGKKAVEASKGAQPQQKKPPNAPVPQHATALLLDLVAHPLLANTQRQRGSALSQGTFSRAVAAIKSRGFAGEVRWGRYRFLVLTEAGKKHVKSAHGLDAPKWPGKGGPEHRLAVQLLKRVWQDRGYKAGVEACVGPGRKLVDVFAEKTETGERLAIEYAHGESDEDENLKKDLTLGGVNKVIFVFPDKATQDRWKKRFEAKEELRRLLSRAELTLMAHVLKEIAS